MKTITDRYQCCGCGRRWERSREPGPYRGLGYDENGDLTDDEDRMVSPELYSKPECPFCGSLYYLDLAYSAGRRKKKKRRGK